MEKEEDKKIIPLAHVRLQEFLNDNKYHCHRVIQDVWMSESGKEYARTQLSAKMEGVGLEALLAQTLVPMPDHDKTDEVLSAWTKSLTRALALLGYKIEHGIAGAEEINKGVDEAKAAVAAAMGKK